MNDVKQRNRRRRQRKRSQNHKRSVLAISAVVLMLTVMVSANSMTLKAKNREYQAQETELKEQIQAEQDRKKEIKELEKYVGTDKYVEDVAKEKLGLVHDNEIVFKSKTNLIGMYKHLGCTVINNMCSVYAEDADDFLKKHRGK